MSVINPLAAIVPVAPASAWHPPREGREHDLRMEQIVRASVAEGGQERVLLEMGQRRFWAETGVPLKTGQALSLQVMATAPRLELKVVADPAADRLGRLLHLLGGKWELAGVLAELLDESQPAPRAGDAGRGVLGQVLNLLTTAPEALSGDGLRELLRKFGPLADGSTEVFREALQTAYQQLSTARDPRAEEVSRLFQHLELSLLCQARLAQAGFEFFPLPLPFLENGYLIAERRRACGEEPPHASLSLHLSLRGLGDLRVDFLYEAPGLFLRFCCSSPAAMTFMAGFHDELREGFQAFSLRGVSFVGGAESPFQALLRRLLPAGEGVLNTRV
jgi:hypothetical protein